MSRTRSGFPGFSFLSYKLFGSTDEQFAKTCQRVFPYFGINKYAFIYKLETHLKQKRHMKRNF